MSSTEQQQGAAPSSEPAKSHQRPRWRALLTDWLLWPAAFALLYFLMRPAPSGPHEREHLKPVSLTDVSTGQHFELPSKGPALIEVFASWCSACKRSNSMLGMLGAPTLPYYMISVDELLVQAQGAKRSWPIEGTVLHDDHDQVSRLWNIQVLPTFILLDEKGEVTRVSTGMPGALDLHAFSEAAKRAKP